MASTITDDKYNLQTEKPANTAVYIKQVNILIDGTRHLRELLETATRRGIPVCNLAAAPPMPSLPHDTTDF